jgi:capsule polysaccharide export protein KpsE/RkpR
LSFGGAPTLLDFHPVATHNARMNAIMFDTLGVARTLRAKGFTPEQADGIAEVLGTASHEEVATKADLATLEAVLKSDVAELRAELKTDIASVRGEIAELRAELKTDIASVRGEIADLKGEIAGLRGEIAGLKGEIADLRGEIGGIKGEIGGIKGEIGGIKADILKWVVGAIGFQTVATLGTVIALVRIFAK